MRISSSYYTSAVAVCSLAAPTTFAFLPSTRQHLHHTTTSTQQYASLSDQLSSVSYDFSSWGPPAKTAATSVVTPSVPIENVVSPNTGVALPDIAGVADSLSSIGKLLPSLPTSLPDISLPLPPTVSSIAEASDAVVSVVQLYETLADEKLEATLGTTWLSVKEQLGPLFNTLIHPDLPPSVTLLIASYVTYSIVNTILSFGKEPPPQKPYPMNKYDPISARMFFDGKWNLVLSRAISISFLSVTFLSALALDYVTGNLDKNAEVRAEELSVLLTKLGPSFIKIGQSLSIRTDLLSPAYVKGLKTLQDQVPPFSTAEARDIIENELGSTIAEIFDDSFPNEPIAAASLGQVYYTTVRETGKEVAVKVQRPNIMNQIALDMHLIREVAPPIKRIFNLNTDFVGVVDIWGAGFVDELDYIEEALNAKSFTESIEQTPLSGVAFAPPVVDELTTRRVLTTEWVVGERLDKSAKEDVSILCSIAMNSYLTMMLETGLLVSTTQQMK